MRVEQSDPNAKSKSVGAQANHHWQLSMARIRRGQSRNVNGTEAEVSDLVG